jgi:N-formylglutamate deformylase
MGSFLPTPARLEYELLIMTDAWTDKLVEPMSPGATRVVFPVSRLVVDPERFVNDDDEPMASKGMGATYTRLSTGEALRHLNHADRDHLLASYYVPHHRSLTQAVDNALSDFGDCLIIDVHSFASTPLPHEPDQSSGRAEICIGFDAFHSPFSKATDILDTSRRFGFGGSVNTPFSGSIVPSKFWRVDQRVRSFMIEVRRDIYMNEETGARREEFDQTALRICALLEALAALNVQLPEQRRHVPLHPEDSH